MKAVFLALVVALFTVSACDRGEPAGTHAAKKGDGPEIKLLEAGRSPRKALRFTAQKGMKRTMTIAMDMAMTMDLGGAPTTTRVPTIKMPMDLVVTDVTDFSVTPVK